MTDFEPTTTEEDEPVTNDAAESDADATDGEDEAAPMVAPNGPGGGIILSTEPEVDEAEKTDIEVRAEEVAEANALDTVNKDGYTPGAPHPSEREPKSAHPGSRTDNE